MKKIKFWLVIAVVAICLFMSLDDYSYRGTIEDWGVEQVRWGNVIFDDSLKTVLAHATIKDWETIGWRGILMDGYFQAGGSGSGSITHIIYVSKEEERMQKAWIEEEIKTLHPSLREGVDRPRFAFRTIGKDWIARLDVMKNEKHRLALYKQDSDLSGKPDFVAEEWNREVEGSAANEIIYFYNDTLSVSLSISSDSKLLYVGG